MNKIYDLCKKDTYQKDGEDKTFWIKVGTLFVKDFEGKESISVKIPDGISVSGWLSAFPQRAKNEQPSQTKPAQPRQPSGFSMPTAPEDDLPF